MLILKKVIPVNGNNGRNPNSTPFSSQIMRDLPRIRLGTISFGLSPGGGIVMGGGVGEGIGVGGVGWPGMFGG